MPFKVEITPQAQGDIAHAYDYIRQFSKAAADRWVSRLRQQIASLDEMPTRCPPAPEAEVLGAELRQLLVGRRSGTYRVVFRVVTGGSTPVVQVLAVRQGARKPLEPEDLAE